MNYIGCLWFYIGCLWFCVTLHNSGVVHPSCVCDIQSKNEFVNCSHMKLKKIPDCVPASVVSLFLSHNRFKTLAGSPFKRFSVLRYLDLSFNKLQNLVNDTFLELSSLHTLILTSNPLHFNNSFSKGVFQPLKNLEELHIEGTCNSRQHFECNYIDDQLSRVPSLKRLYLDGFYRRPLGPDFSSLDNLKEIHIDGNNGFCVMDSLSNRTFASLRNIRLNKLILRFCEISVIHPYTFAGLKNLTVLSLHHNRKLCNQGLANLTIGLNRTTLKFLDISEICRSSQFNISPHTFTGFLGTQIESLDMTKNKLQTIDPEAILMLPKTLKYLSLRDNFLTSARFLDNICVLTNLITFDASFQIHPGVNTPYHQAYYQSETLDQPNSKDVILKENTRKKFESESYDCLDNFLTSNGLQESAEKFTNKIHSDNSVVLPMNLLVLNISFINLEYPVFPLNFDPNNSLEILDMSNGLWRAWYGPWKGLHMLKVLNLTNNNIKEIKPYSFSYMKDLRLLLLGQNKLGRKIMHQEHEKIFWNLNSLELLNLSENDIRDLPEDIFTELRNLKYLSLADNSLFELKFHVHSLVNLRTLDLSGNQIQTFPKQFMKELDILSEERNIEINVEKNLLVCDCDTKAFVAWLTTTKVNINKYNVSCQYTNKTTVALVLISDIHDQLSAECDAWIIVSSCIVGFVVLNLVLSLIAIIYYKRWNFKYLFYMGRQNLNPYHPIEDREIELEHDVYISYERDQIVRHNLNMHEFMTKNIYKKLKEQGLRVIIRDELDIGKRQYDIISQALRKCRKVIALVSKDYCSDFWNVYEFNIAALEGIYTKRQVLIPIVIGSVDKENLKSDVYAFLKPQTVPRYKVTTPEKALTDFVLDAVRWDRL